MKKVYTYLLAICLIAVSGHSAWAQSAPMFYNGTSGTSCNSFPLSTTGSNKVQWIYAPGVLNSSGTTGTPAFKGNITRLYFRICGTANATNVYTNFSISLGQNVGTNPTFGTATATVPFLTGLTQVYFQPSVQLTGATANSWYGVTLQTPFPYDPTQSLIFEMTVTGGTGNTVAQVSTTGMMQRIYANYTSSTGTQNTGLVDFGVDLVPASTSPDDGGVSAILSPVAGCAGIYDVKAKVENFGINQINSINVNWSVNSVLQTPVAYNQLLDTFYGVNPHSAEVILGQVTLTANQTDVIQAWTTDPNNQTDTVNDNDTTTLSSTNLPTITNFPYYEDYEAGQADWFIQGLNTSWGFGTPAKSNIIGAASGINAFVTGGLSTATYNTNENSQVYSPCFDMTSFEGTPWVALDVNWYSESSYDGAVLQVSRDGGNKWENVGKVGDPNNWYTDASLDGRAGGSNDGWAGTGTASSQGWKRAKHVLDANVTNQVTRFRIAFGSDGSVTYDGFAFDNFTVVDFKQANLGPDKRSLCQSPGIILDPNVNFFGTIGWSTGDSTNETIVVTTPGIYNVTYIDSMINESTSDQIEIIQSAPPVIDWRDYEDTVCMPNGQTTLDPKLPFDLTYTWTPGNYNFPFLLVAGNIQGPGLHQYKLHVEDSVLCTDEDVATVAVVVCTGIEDQLNERVKVYPIPVNDMLVVETNELNGSTNIELSDIEGRMMYQATLRAGSSQTHNIDVSQMAKGAYVLRLINNNEVSTHKIIKE